MRVHRCLALFVSLVMPLSAAAKDLANLFPNLVQQAQVGLLPVVTIEGGPSPGTFVAQNPITATFDARASVDNLSGQIAGQFQRFPVGSTVAAFTFQFDPELNVFTRSTEGLGPLLSERAQTTGKGKFNVSFAYSRVDFDVFDGDHLNRVKVGYVGSPVTTSTNQPQTTFNFPNGGFVDYADGKPIGLGAGAAIRFDDPQGGTTINGDGVVGV